MRTKAVLSVLLLTPALLALGTAAHAQYSLQNLPPNTVIGRVGSNLSGPAQAIPLPQFTIGAPILGNGAAVPTSGSVSGNTTKFVSTTGTLTNGDCVQWNNGNAIDSGGTCGGSGGSGDVSSGMAGQAAYYATSGTTVSGESISTLIGAGGITNSLLASMAANTVKCNDTTSSATPTDCSYPTVNVKDYGATGNCSTDDTTSIQNAINALPASGGNVIFPATTSCYLISSTITVGNGTSSSASTVHGVCLQGVGLPTFNIFTGYPSNGPVNIRWNGSSSGTMVKFVGPLQGWCFKNFSLDGISANHPEFGVELISAQYGRMENVQINGATAGALVDTTWAPFSGVGDANSLHNTFINLNITLANNNNAIAISLDSGDPSSPTSDASYETFINVTLANTSAASGQTGVYMRGTDTDMFYNLHTIWAGSGNTGIIFDYSSNGDFPSAVKFFGLDNSSNGSATPFSVNGTPLIGNNEVFGMGTANGAVVPNNLAGISYTGGLELGYFPGSGVGGSVTQNTGIGDAVTLNTMSGQITTISFAWNAGSGQAFSVSDSLVGAHDTVSCSQQGDASHIFNCFTWNITNGSFSVGLYPFDTVTEAVTINFNVIKGTDN